MFKKTQIAVFFYLIISIYYLVVIGGALLTFISKYFEIGPRISQIIFFGIFLFLGFSLANISCPQCSRNPFGDTYGFGYFKFLNNRKTLFPKVSPKCIHCSKVLDKKFLNTAGYIPSGFRLVPIYQRIFSFIIDMLVLILVYPYLLSLFKMLMTGYLIVETGDTLLFAGSKIVGILVINVAVYLLFPLYFILSEYFFGATPGMAVMSMEIRNTSGKIPPVLKLIYRFLWQIPLFPCFPFGILYLSISNNLMMQDYLTDTFIVRKNN